MAGFRRNKEYVLEFEGDLAGLEIRTRGASVHLMLRASTLAESLDNLKGAPNAEEQARIDELFRLFAGCPQDCTQEHDIPGKPGGHYSSRILSWNFEDEGGEPLAPTYDNFIEQDFDMTVPAIFAWIGTIGSSRGPLDGTSSDGGPSAEESIPMETLSDGRQF